MVLDVFVEGCDDSFSCSYSGFSKFRSEILRAWNSELGKIYNEKYGFLLRDDFGPNELDKLIYTHLRKGNPFDIRMNKILDEYDKPYNEGMKLFCYHSDCDGKITPEECALLLKSFERVDPEKFDKSDSYDNEWYRQSFDIWKKMMAYAIKNNKSILFH